VGRQLISAGAGDEVEAFGSLELRLEKRRGHIMGRIKDLLAGLLGGGIGGVLLAVSVLSFPLNMLVLIRWYGLEWWTAMIAVGFLSIIPVVGQRAGPGCLNSNSASISGASAGVRPPCGAAG
jgi:hypothetical protein